MTVTSRRMPSASWRYQRGKVSLSPFVKRIPYGSTLMSRLYAQSRAAWSCARLAHDQLSTSGMSASPSTGTVRESRVLSSWAASRQSVAIPTPAHSPQSEKLTVKK